MKMNKKQMVGIFAFCLTALVGNATSGILAYIMQSYSDVSATVVSNILSMPALIGTFYGLAVGSIHKRIPAKYLMIFSQLCAFAYGMIFLFFGGKVSIYVLLAAAGLIGIGQGSNYTLLSIALAEAIPDLHTRDGMRGICMSFMTLGSVAFQTLSGFLAVKVWNRGYIPFFAILATVAIQMICLPLGKWASDNGNKEANGEIKDVQPELATNEKVKLPPIVWVVCIHYFVFFLSMYVFGLNISEYIITTYKLGTSAEAGIASSMVSVGGVATGILFGVYSKFLKKYTGCFLMGLAFLALTIPVFITNSVFALYVCGLMGGFAMMGINTYILGFLGKVVPQSAYSKALSLYAGFQNAGLCLAVTVLAFVTKLVCGDGTDVHTKFVVASVGTAITFITSFFVYAKRENA